MDNRCVCCGEIIPEGAQVCLSCIYTPAKERIMTNEERIRNLLTRKQLAGLLIQERRDEDYDEGIDGEMCAIGFSTTYITSDGLEYYEDRDSALQHECWWLAQPAQIS